MIYSLIVSFSQTICSKFQELLLSWQEVFSQHSSLSCDTQGGLPLMSYWVLMNGELVGAVTRMLMEKDLRKMTHKLENWWLQYDQVVICLVSRQLLSVIVIFILFLVCSDLSVIVCLMSRQPPTVSTQCMAGCLWNNDTYYTATK